MNSPWRPPRRNRTLGGTVGVTSEGSVQRRVCTQWGGREQSWDQWKVLGRPEVTGQS